MKNTVRVSSVPVSNNQASGGNLGMRRAFNEAMVSAAARLR